MPRDNFSINRRDKSINVMKQRKEIINFIAEKGNVSDSVKKKFDAYKSRFIFGQSISKRDYDLFLTMSLFGEKQGEVALNDKKLNILKYFDSNNNGTFFFLLAEQLKKYLDFAKNEEFSVDEALNYLQSFDKNNDGVLDKNEPISFDKKVLNENTNNNEIVDKIILKDTEQDKYKLAYDDKGNLTIQQNNLSDKTTKKIEIKTVEPPKQEAKPVEKKTVEPPKQEAKPVEKKAVELPKQEAKPVEKKTVEPPKQEVKPVEKKAVELPKSEIKKPISISRIGSECFKDIQNILDNINDKDTLAEFMRTKDLYQYTPLKNAIFNQNPKIVEILLNKIKDYPDIQEEVLLEGGLFKSTPLHDVAQKGYSEIADLILNSVKNNKPLFEKMMLAKTSGLDGTPFSNAVLYNKAETVKVMLNYIDNQELFEKLVFDKSYSKAYIYTYAKGETKTLLENAAKKYGIDLTKKIETEAIKKQKEEKIPSIVDKTAEEIKNILAKAKDEKQLEKILLEKDKNGNTPLHNADKEKAEIILNSISDNSNLLKKVLLAENYSGVNTLKNATPEILIYFIA